jgi:hypothetical protein
MTTILPARVLRFYALALASLGAAAYLAGGVTADICSAYETRRVAPQAVGGPALGSSSLC